MKKLQNISKEMKKPQFNFYSIIGMVLLLITVSCQDLTEINTSPNQLNASDINVKYVLTSVLSSSSTQYIRSNSYGGTVTLSEAMQYMQRDYIDWQGTNTFVWNPVAASSMYSSLQNSQYIYDNAQYEALEGNQKFYTAVGQIMRSFWYGFLSSLYGDIPYSEALKAKEGNFTPIYDNQKDIFVGILADLKSANDLLATVTTVDGASASDIMFQGDVLKWRKFCNSLRLRYLMRLSEKMADAGIDVKSEFNSIVSNAAANPIFTSSSDNASIPYIGSDAANSWYGGPLAWTNRSEFYRRKPCATFVDELRIGMDPRLTTFIRPVDTQIKISSETPVYAKLPDGQIIRNIPASTPGIENVNTFRYVGLPPALQDPNLYNMYTGTDFNAIKALNPGIYTDLAANPNVSYLADKYALNSFATIKAVYMSYSELSFILAEAKLKGWITSGTTLDYYLAGIVGSLRQYNISNGSMSVYDQNTDAIIPFDENAFIANLTNKFNSASDDTERLTQLMTQKWLAAFMTPEFWFDWRRTGLPNFGVNLIAGSNGSKIPVRYIYGDDERILNGPNVTDAVSRLEPAENSQWSKMWLLKGTNKPW